MVTGASIGITLCSPEDGSADELVRHADMAMYHAKARGRRGRRSMTARCRTARRAA